MKNVSVALAASLALILGVGFGCGGNTVCDEAAEIMASCDDGAGAEGEGEGEGEASEGTCETGTLEACTASCIIFQSDTYCDIDVNNQFDPEATELNECIGKCETAAEG